MERCRHQDYGVRNASGSYNGERADRQDEGGEVDKFLQQDETDDVFGDLEGQALKRF